MAIIEFVLKGFTSWKTTAMGVVVLVGSAGKALTTVATAATALLDGDPSTVADWGSVTEAFALVSVGFGLIFARDNNKSSEAVKAK